MFFVCKNNNKKQQSFDIVPIDAKGTQKVTRSRTSAGAGQAHQRVAGSPAKLSLGVGDGAVLLTEVKPQLTLVSEVEVAFFTLRTKGGE